MGLRFMADGSTLVIDAEPAHAPIVHDGRDNGFKPRPGRVRHPLGAKEDI